MDALLYGYSFSHMMKGMPAGMINGLLWSWQVHKDKYSLKRAIFTHQWVDALIYYKWNGTIGGDTTRSNEGSTTGFRYAVGAQYHLKF